MLSRTITNTQRSLRVVFTRFAFCIVVHRSVQANVFVYRKRLNALISEQKLHLGSFYSGEGIICR